MARPASQSAPRDTPSDDSPPVTELSSEPPNSEPGVSEPAGTGRGAKRSSKWPRRIAIGAVAVVAVAFVAVGLVTVIEHDAYAGKVLPGVEVDGVAAAGHREVAVYDSVARLGVTLGQSPVRVRIGNRDLSANPSLLALTVNAHATAEAAVNVGRTGSPLNQMFGTALRWFRPDKVSLRVDYDQGGLEGMLDGWSAETDDGEIEGGLRFDGATVVPIEPHSGTGIVRAQARRSLQHMLTTSQRGVLTLAVGTIRPRLDAKAVATAAATARALLTGNHAIVTGTTTVQVTPKQLAQAIGTRIVRNRLIVTLDAKKLHDALASQLTPIESAPVDASFIISEQNTPQVVPSRDGRQIDMNAVTSAILSGRRRVVAPLRDVAPAHDTKWAQALGITKPVSSFTTYYPAGETRVINIHRGADLLNNTIVEPGKIFSLNQTVGPRTAARGFVTAPVFAQGEFFDDYGGGVSQLATTTYNAAFFGGYQDITHQPHTIYISRYPPGREATVNYGVIDLKFRDDSPHGILIRTYYSSTSITVALYGDTDGRTVREENREQSNPVAVTNEMIECPTTKIIDPNDVCATLSAGQTEQVSTGDSGFDVAFDRVIDQPGKPERREHYTWHYTMLPNQILVGSGSSTPASTSG